MNSKAKVLGNIRKLKLYHDPAVRSSRVKWLLHELVGDDLESEVVSLYDAEHGDRNGDLVGLFNGGEDDALAVAILLVDPSGRRGGIGQPIQCFELAARWSPDHLDLNVGHYLNCICNRGGVLRWRDTKRKLVQRRSLLGLKQVGSPSSRPAVPFSPF